MFNKSKMKVNISSTDLHLHDKKFWWLSVQLLQSWHGQEDTWDGRGWCQGQCQTTEDVQEASATSPQSRSSPGMCLCTNLCIWTNSLSYIHRDRLWIFLNLLYAWSSLAQSISSVVVHNDIDSIFDVKVQQIRIVLNLFRYSNLDIVHKIQRY